MKGVISKLAVGAMKEAMKEQTEEANAYISQYHPSSQPVLAKVTTEIKQPDGGASPLEVKETFVPSPGTPLPPAARPEEKKEALPLPILLGVAAASIASLLLLFSLFSSSLEPVPELSWRLAFALRCVAFSAVPAPLVLLAGTNSTKMVPHLWLCLFFSFSLLSLATFEGMAQQTASLFLFALYYFVGTMASLVFEVVQGSEGLSNPGLLVTFSTSSLLLLYNLYFGLFGS